MEEGDLFFSDWEMNIIMTTVQSSTDPKRCIFSVTAPLTTPNGVWVNWPSDTKK
jgi:hypothetical protein